MHTAPTATGKVTRFVSLRSLNDQNGIATFAWVRSLNDHKTLGR